MSRLGGAAARHHGGLRLRLTRPTENGEAAAARRQPGVILP